MLGANGGRRGRRKKGRKSPLARRRCRRSSSSLIVVGAAVFFSLHLSFSIALSPRLCLPLFPTHSLLARMPAVTVEPLLPPQPTSMTLFVF